MFGSYGSYGGSYGGFGWFFTQDPDVRLVGESLRFRVSYLRSGVPDGLSLESGGLPGFDHLVCWRLPTGASEIGRDEVVGDHLLLAAGTVAVAVTQHVADCAIGFSGEHETAGVGLPLGGVDRDRLD